MGMDLPGGLESMLNELGFRWPEVDETDLMQLGGAWTQFGSTVGQLRQRADEAARSIREQNHGAAIDAFVQRWADVEAPDAVLAEAETGMQVGGALVIAAGGLVLALKVATIVNIGILLAEIASAIAEAFFTFGASLAEIPLFKIATQKILDVVLDQTVNAIMEA